MLLYSCGRLLLLLVFSVFLLPLQITASPTSYVTWRQHPLIVSSNSLIWLVAEQLSKILYIFDRSSLKQLVLKTNSTIIYLNETLRSLSGFLYVTLSSCYANFSSQRFSSITNGLLTNFLARSIKMCWRKVVISKHCMFFGVVLEVLESI